MKKLVQFCLVLFVIQAVANPVKFPTGGSLTSRKYRDEILCICDQKLTELRKRTIDLAEALKKTQEYQSALEFEEK